MIVLDASVLIAYLDGSDAHHDTAWQLLEREVDEALAASPLTLAEVLVAPVRAGRVDAAVAALRELEVIEQPFPAGAAVRLAELRAATGLRMPDCCVLLAAEATRGLVASFDAELVRATGKLRIGTLTA